MNATPVRTAIFVPGNRPERFGRALASGADRVIVDFEDAVEEGDKLQARENLGDFLQVNPQASLLVRINAPGHGGHAGDIEFCRSQAGVSAVLLPKVESAGQVERVAACGKPVWPLVESAGGLLALAEIARVEGVERLSFGGLDLGLDLGLTSGTEGAERMLDQARYTLLLHSRGAGLAPPLDTVFPTIHDREGLVRAARNAREMGFAGLLCIHPSQVRAVHQALMPDAEELAWARRVLAGGVGGVFVVDGQMVDLPVIERTRRLLQRAGLPLP